MNLLVRFSVLLLRLIHWTYHFVKSLFCTEEEKKCVSPSDDPLLKLSGLALAEKIRERKVYSQEVVQAYVRRIKQVNPIINAIVQERFEAALEDAKRIDRYLDENQDKIEELRITKPLFGIPITIKESIAVEGLSYTGGSLTRKHVKADNDSVVVQRLKENGLIPLLVSNTPEYCTSLETNNELTGYTHNPYNTLYTAGGSSGGEGALLGAGASLIGLGSDIAGSIRIPAMFNGVFGHKPTKRVVPLQGHWPLSEEEIFQDFIVIGPLTRYAEDLLPVLEIIVGPNSRVLELKKEVDLTKIQVFYMEDTGNNFCLPATDKAIKTAVKTAAHYLSKECHCHISNHKFEELGESIEIAAMNLLGIEKFPSPLEDTEVQYNLLLELIKKSFGKSMFSSGVLLFSLMHKINKRIAFNKEKYHKKLEVLKKVLEDVLGDNGVLIYPCNPFGATKRGAFFIGMPTCSYVTIANLTGLPATAVPTGFDSNKMPTGIQVIAGPYQDRLTLAVAQELEKCFGGWQAVP